jgi:hypothetical protein
MASPFQDAYVHDFGLPPLPDSDNSFSAWEETESTSSPSQSKKSGSSPESKKDSSPQHSNENSSTPQSSKSSSPQQSNSSSSSQQSSNNTSPPAQENSLSLLSGSSSSNSPPSGSSASNSPPSDHQSLLNEESIFCPPPNSSDERGYLKGTNESNPYQPATSSSLNSFGTPNASAPPSKAGSTTGFQLHHRTYFHSRRIGKGEVPRPWLDKKDPREKWVTIIPLIGLFLGLAVSGFLIWEGLQTVQQHVYCPVLIQEDFSRGLDPKIWTKEVEVGGFG